MSGDYIFPEKEFDPVEPADPDELNRVLQAPANLIGSGLGAHNLNDGLKASAMVVEPSAYHSLTFDNTAKATGIVAGGGSNPSKTGAGGNSVYEIPSDFEWHILESLSRTITSAGSDVLMVVGWAQYSVDNGAGHKEARIQLGIRVDGVLWPGSKTGHDRDDETFGEPWKMPAAKVGLGGKGSYSSRSAYYGYGQVSGIQQQTGALRTMVVVPVQPGAHTIEIVGRRVFTPNAMITSTDWLVTYNRQMTVLSLNGGSTASFGASSLAVPSLQDQDVLSNAALMTSRLDVLSGEMNTMAESSVGRAALRNVHLPSKVIAADQQSLTPAGPVTFNNTWPGYGSSDFTGTPGWAKIMTANNGGAGWDQSVSYGTDILILANVEMAETPSYGFACLYYTTGGADQAIGGTEAIVHRHPDPPGTWEDRFDLPLMWVISSTGGGVNYTEFGVAVCKDAGGAHKYHRASIQVIFLRK